MLKAVAERDKGDYAASRTTFLKILSDYPDRHAVLYNLGILYQITTLKGSKVRSFARTSPSMT